MKVPVRQAIWPEHVAIAVIEALLFVGVLVLVGFTCSPTQLAGSMSWRVNGTMVIFAAPIAALVMHRCLVKGGATIAERCLGLGRIEAEGEQVSNSEVIRYWLRRSWPLLTTLSYFASLGVIALVTESRFPGTGNPELGAWHFDQMMARVATWLAIPTVPLLIFGWWDSWRVRDRLVLWKLGPADRRQRGFEVLVDRDEAEG